MYADIFIENNFSKIDNLYTYKFEKDLDVVVGKRVKVSFGKSIRVGIVLNIYEKYERDFEGDFKNIIEVLDTEPIINKDLIELALWMKDRYILGYSKAFSPVMPPGNLKRIKKKILINYYPRDNDIEKLEKIDFKKSYEDLPIEQKKLVDYLYKKGILSFSYVPITEVKEKKILYLKLKDKDLKISSLKNITTRQLEVINYLKKNGKIKKKDLMMELKISDSPIKSLIKKELIKEEYVEVYREVYEKEFKNKINVLNEEQNRALNSILNTKKEVSLLHGLTGSGKTEVYLNLVKKVVEQGAEAIVLVPEIGLTPQMIERFKSRFSNRVSILHSKLSSGERYDEYRKIVNKDVDIVVGVRSAVFAPFKNLKLIIIDESHDSSYEYHDSLKYDTIEVAIRRMKDKGKVVLGSATPSIESYYKAKKNIYNLEELTRRANKTATLPNTKIVDMRDELIRGNISIFSNELKEKIKEKLENKEQIILFLNRRGYSNFMSCRSCGHVIKCENCDISMTYHKTKDRLICHYCGMTKKVPKVCPKCGSKYIKSFGIGTEQVEDEVLKLFPNARVLRMDRDTTSRKNSFDNFYKKIKNREVDIIIGTQMVSKGFDFEDVTLVGVISADLSLYVSDYRAVENTFQLITQVSGRAGRALKKGDVIIQSYNPENYAILHSAKGNFIDFYEEELEERRLYEYPPFKKLISLEVSSKNEEMAEKWARAFLVNIGKRLSNLDVMATDLIKSPKIKNIYRVKFSLKVSPKDEDMLIKLIKRVIILSKIDLKRDVYLNINF